MRLTLHGESGWLGRALTTVVAIAVLTTARPAEGWAWFVLGGGLAVFLAGTVLMTVRPYVALALLGTVAVSNAMISGLPGSNALVLVLVAIGEFAGLSWQDIEPGHLLPQFDSLAIDRYLPRSLDAVDLGDFKSDPTGAIRRPLIATEPLRFHRIADPRRGADGLLERARQTDDAILAIHVFAPDGRILRSTDRSHPATIPAAALAVRVDKRPTAPSRISAASAAVEARMQRGRVPLDEIDSFVGVVHQHNPSEPSSQQRFASRSTST